LARQIPSTDHKMYKLEVNYEINTPPHILPRHIYIQEGASNLTLECHSLT